MHLSKSKLNVRELPVLGNLPPRQAPEGCAYVLLCVLTSAGHFSAQSLCFALLRFGVSAAFATFSHPENFVCSQRSR